MTTGEVQRKLRESLGIKQIQLAKASGIHQSRLSLIENGWQDARPDELARIEAAIKSLARGSHAEAV
jgi:transcriptional regulator with XRE-family HTH domain